MSGGIVLKSLPKEPKQHGEKVDYFSLQKDNMPCKECSKGKRDCECQDSKGVSLKAPKSPYKEEDTE